MGRPEFKHATLLSTYQYLRVAMIGVVLSLVVAVLVQTREQGHFLSSISAYYYTPAQAIFVGVLVAMGVTMLVIRGIKDEEDILLNLAGVLAPVVAFVPTSRGDDFKAVLGACQRGDLPALDQNPSSGTQDCIRAAELHDAAIANATNNLIALFAVGFLGLVAAWLLAKKARNTAPFRIGFRLVTAAYLLGLIGLVVARTTFIEVAHYPAAIAMFACIVGVALINAMRRQDVKVKEKPRLRDKVLVIAKSLVRPQDPYAYIALAMLATAVGGVTLKLLDAFEDTIFWTEFGLIVLFAVFWGLQTKENWDGDSHENGSSVAAEGSNAANS